MYLGWRGVSRVAAPVPGRPGSVAGGHVREPYTVFNAVTRGRRAVASVASHDSKPSLRGVSGAWRWTSIRLFPALTDPGQRDMPRPAAGVRGRARGGSDRLDGIIRPRDVHSSSRAPRARRLAPSGYATATRHSTPHTGHGGPSPSAVRPGGVASFALRGLPVPPSLAFGGIYTLVGIRIHYSGLGFNWFNILCRSVIPRNGTDDHRWYPEPRIRGRLI